MNASFHLWLSAIRPKTLTAAVVPVLVGTALSQHLQQRVDNWLVAFIMISAVLIQISTNLFNDALDFRRGADTAERVGPLRISQSGLATVEQVEEAALLCLALAIVAGAPLVLVGGWPILIIGLVAAVLGYAYTGGPYPLAYHGLGDLFVFLFFGLIAVGGTVFLLTGSWHWQSWLAGAQLGSLATALIAINNLRDVDGDIRAKKLTLAVRFGQRFAKAEITVALIAPFVFGLFWFPGGAPLAALAPVICVLLAIRLVEALWPAPPSAEYNRFLEQTALIHGLFGMALAGALWWR